MAKNMSHSYWFINDSWCIYEKLSVIALQSSRVTQRQNLPKETGCAAGGSHEGVMLLLVFPRQHNLRLGEISSKI